MELIKHYNIKGIFYNPSNLDLIFIPYEGLIDLGSINEKDSYTEMCKLFDLHWLFKIIL